MDQDQGGPGQTGKIGGQGEMGPEKTTGESPLTPDGPAVTTPAGGRRTGPDTGRSRGSDLPSSPGTTQRDTTGAHGAGGAPGAGGVEGTPGRDVDAMPRPTDEDSAAGPRERE